ncbi:hypothetical protein [Clostridium hydrogenum]|uniref:hypothetical protein n=1 Tax=Clostridium hydrogenum TaxID=2855764 RepID=UPI001F32C86C|nr:hypothetical protein [Clostridium hydrogenum]
MRIALEESKNISERTKFYNMTSRIKDKPLRNLKFICTKMPYSGHYGAHEF